MGIKGLGHAGIECRASGFRVRALQRIGINILGSIQGLSYIGINGLGFIGLRVHRVIYSSGSTHSKWYVRHVLASDM